MIQPEDDFPTWLYIASSSVGDLSSFAAIVPQIENLLSQIIENQKFSNEKLAGKEQNFAAECYFKIIPKLKKIGRINEDEKETVFRIFKIFIKFGIDSIKINNTDYLAFLTQLVPDSSWNIISQNSDMKINDELLEFFRAENTVPLLQEFLCNSADTQQKVFTAAMTLIQLQNYFEEININEVSNLSTTNLIKIGKEKIRDLVPNGIYQFFDTLSKKINSDDAIMQWLELFYILADCDIFDRQIFGYKVIKYMLENANFQEVTLSWFASNDRFGILKKKDLHTEIMPQVAGICSILSCKNILPFEVIEEIWSMNSTIHSSILEYFYNMFTIMCQSVSSSELEKFSYMIINPSDKSQTWFSFIIDISEIMGKREDAGEAYAIIRNEVWNIAFDETNELCDEAKEKLKFVLKHHTTSELLCDYAREMIEKLDPHDAFSILEDVVNSVAIPDAKLAGELLNKAIDTLKAVDSKQHIYTFIINLCSQNSLLISDNEASILFSLPKDKEFFNFLQELVTYELCDVKKIMEFLQSVKPEDVDDSFITLLKNLILKQIPAGGITDEPFDGEDILWKLVCSETKQRRIIMDLLVKTYIPTSNELDGTKIVFRFLKKWRSVFESTENKHYMFDLLRYFIIDAEYGIDYDEYNAVPHGSEVSKKVTVEITGYGIPASQKHVVYDTMTIGVLSVRVARYAYKKPGDFSLQKQGKELYSNSKVRDFLQDGIVQIAAVPASLNILKKSFNILPSEIISQTDVVDILIDYLKKNTIEAKMLLDYLPTITYIKATIEALHYLDSYDYRTFLPIEYPMLFNYIFESLISMSSIEDMKRTHAIDYLIDCIAESPIEITNQIIVFLEEKLDSETQKNYAQDIFDKCFYRLFNHFDDSNENFCMICSFLVKLLDIKDVHIVLPSYFNEAAKKFLFSDNENVVNSTKDLFDELVFDQSVIISLLKEADENQKRTLFLALLNHIDEFDPSVESMIIDGLDRVFDCVWLNEALNCMCEMVKFGIDEAHAHILSNHLIDSYLVVDTPCDRSTLYNACRILGKLKTNELLEHIEGLYDDMPVCNQWNIKGDNAAKSPYGSGLINLGATCFLNSTLQQFFAIPTLRKAILAYSGEDVFLNELKLLFARMLLSNAHAQTTSPLVQKWVGWDGEHMDPLTQQDACEFVQNLLDKLEKGLGIDFIHELFQGEIIHHTEGIEEEYHAESKEPFYTFSVQVKGKSNFKEAMEEFSTPDFFTGSNQYNAEELGHKIDAKRYATIGKMPPFFIIQLSRFEYNYQTWTRTKIDEPFSFPVDLKINGNSYILSGVIVHIGTAEFGHYVSYVRDRATGQWRLCNDDVVTASTESQVLEASYGQKSKSAYLLFYDKADNDVSDAGSVNEELKNTIASENIVLDKQNLLFSTAFLKLNMSLKTRESLVYYCSIFPYSVFQNYVSKFAGKLLNALNNDPDLREDLIDFVNDKSILVPLVYVYDKTLRQETASLIETVIDKATTETLDALFAAIRNVPAYSYCINEYFHVIDMVLNEELTKYAVEKDFVHALHALLTKNIPDHIKEKNIAKTDYYMVTDFTSLLILLTKLPLSEMFLALLTSDDFLKNTVGSQTTIESIVLLLKNVKMSSEAFSQFIQKNAMSLPFDRVAELVLRFYEEEGFDYISANKFYFNDHVATQTDWLSSFALCILHHNMNHFFADSLDKWAAGLVSSDEIIRSMVLHCISYILPVETFSRIGVFPANSFQSELFNFTQKAVNDEIVELGNKVLKYITQNISSFADIIKNKYCSATAIANPLCDVLFALYDITKAPIVLDHINLIIDTMRTVAKPFDNSVQKCLAKLASAGVFVPVADDFVDVYCETNYIACVFFFNDILPHIEHEGVSEKTANTIFRNFASPPRLPNRNQQCLALAAREQPEVAKAFVSENTISKQNIGNLVNILKSANLKIPIFDKLVEAIPFLSLSTMNQLVLDCFEVNDGPISDNCFDELIKSPLLSGEARERVLEASGRYERKREQTPWFFVRGNEDEIPTEKEIRNLIQAAINCINGGLKPQLLDGLLELLDQPICLIDNIRELFKPLFEFLNEMKDESELTQKLSSMFCS